MQRVINYSQTTQTTPNTSRFQRTLPITFDHARNQDSEYPILNETLSETSHIIPNILERPNKPMKQSKLLDLMDSKIRESTSHTFEAMAGTYSHLDNS